MLSEHIDDGEFLYRGLISVFYKGRISSAAFKDSLGTSVDRDNLDRTKDQCVESLCVNPSFIGVCRIKTEEVRASEALPLYKYLDENPYHSEIHDSEGRPQVRSGKARKLSKLAQVSWLKES